MPALVSTKFSPGDRALYADGKEVEIVAPSRPVNLNAAQPIVWFAGDDGKPSFDYESEFKLLLDRHREEPLSGRVYILNGELVSERYDALRIDWREGDGF